MSASETQGGAGGASDVVDAPAAGGDGKGSSDPGQMAWPTEVHTIVSDFGPRNSPCLGCSSYHEGLDIGAPEGAPVHAVLNGRVTFRGELSGYGNYVCLTHSDALTTCYGHLSRFGQWEVNDTVTRGSVIGYVGHTGNVTGPHLHFEVRLGGDLHAQAVDPAPYLKGAADAPAGGGEVDTVAGGGCGDQSTGAGTADLTSADVVREPRRMQALPAWATAQGYPRPARGRRADRPVAAVPAAPLQRARPRLPRVGAQHARIRATAATSFPPTTRSRCRAA